MKHSDPSTPARLSPEREAEIRANEFWGPAECRTCVSVLLREIDAARGDLAAATERAMRAERDLAELVAALPRCDEYQCDNTCTWMAWRELYQCDEHMNKDGSVPYEEQAWAPLLRRLARKETP